MGQADGDYPFRGEDLLPVTTCIKAEAVLVTARGKFTSASMLQLRAELGQAFSRAALRRIPCPVVLDLTQITVNDADALLTALLGAAIEAEHRRQPLRVVVDHNRPVLTPLHITGLDSFLALYYSVPQAMTSED